MQKEFLPEAIGDLFPALIRAFFERKVAPLYCVGPPKAQYRTTTANCSTSFVLLSRFCGWG